MVPITDWAGHGTNEPATGGIPYFEWEDSPWEAEYRKACFA